MSTRLRSPYRTAGKMTSRLTTAVTWEPVPGRVQFAHHSMAQGMTSDKGQRQTQINRQQGTTVMATEQYGHASEHGASSARKLRIAICLSHFHPTIGGAERQLLQLARYWTAWGHRVYVFTRPMAGQTRRETVDGIEIRRSLHTLSLGPLFGVTFIGRLTASLLARETV